MKIAYIVFDGITYLDLIGIYDPISRLRSMQFLPDLQWMFCGLSPAVKDNFGLEIKVDNVDQSLEGYDVVIVPGGHGTRNLQHDPAFVTWMKTAESARLKASICTGSLLLGAAGFLQGKRATTNFKEYEALKSYCQEVVKERIVEDGDVITAGAVSASIDLGLYLCEKWAGKEAREVIRTKMDYHG